MSDTATPTAYRNGGELLADILTEAGVDTVFGVISVHNIPLVEAVAGRLRFVPVRHEAAAVNAADGYARASGTIGCALTSTGTGAGNAAGSLIESLSAATSVLHITGQIQSRYLGSGRGFIHETRDQKGMLDAVSRAAFTINSAEEAASVLRRAACLAGDAVGGPVSVEWPIDLQFAPTSDPGTPRPELPEPVCALEPSAAELEKMLTLLGSARQPLLWLGGGATGRTARPLVTRLCESWGAGVITSNSGRGAIPEDHELCIGNYASSPVGRQLLSDADCLLTIGTHFRSNETSDYSVEIPQLHIQVDQDEAAIGRVYPVSSGVHGDATAVLDYLVENRGKLRADKEWRSRVTAARKECRTRQQEGLGPHAEFADAIRTVFPEESPIARDVTIASSSWGNRLLPMPSPEVNIFPRGGGIGQGLGMAIGAAAAVPDQPVLAVCGDGGLAVHLGEILTLAQENPWLVLLVFNDAGYGVLRNMQDSMGTPRTGVDLTTPDFRMLASSCGLDYARIGSRDEVRGVLEDAVALHSAVVVEVDLAAYGDMPAPFTPPVTVPDNPDNPDNNDAEEDHDE
jgi:acetolactate synthase-1/2/3 large subunit